MNEAKNIDYTSVNKKCYFFKLRKIGRAITKIFDSYLHGSEINASQFNLLVNLRDDEPLCDIARNLGMDRTTLSRNLIPLKREGLIEQDETKSDRRAVYYRLTNKGEEAIRETFSLWREANKNVRRLLAEMPSASNAVIGKGSINTVGAERIVNEIDNLLSSWQPAKNQVKH